MKVLTPEIAWHETLPIYSCDLQPLPKGDKDATSSSPSATREPLAELPIAEEDYKGKPEKAADKKGSAKENTPSSDGDSWTRLATAGGDNPVRLWRVNLDWTPPSSVTVTAFKKPLPKGMLQDVTQPPKKNSAGAPGVKVSAAVSEGLVFLATLKRHERLVNVVRWSPSGEFFVG